MDLISTTFSYIEWGVSSFLNNLLWTRVDRTNMGDNHQPNIGNIIVFAVSIGLFLFWMAWMSQTRSLFKQRHEVAIEQPLYGKKWLKDRANQNNVKGVKQQ